MAADAGVLVISYGSREVAIVDALERSRYDVAVYVADKQANPFNVRAAEKSGGEHRVIKGLSIDGKVVDDKKLYGIYDFVKDNKNKINYVIPGCEGPIIDGLRDRVEGDFGIPVIAPTKRYAIEGSKVWQRKLIQACYPEANPRYMVFDPGDYKGKPGELEEAVKEWVNDGLGGVDNCVIKPDKPGFGKGVGVGGEHFHDWNTAFEHFLTLYGDAKEPVIVEERVNGEEFSLQCWVDGEHLVTTPAVRDYKRAFDWDEGPNTGGMGSYKDTMNLLPFMVEKDWEDACLISDKFFKALRGERYNPELKGVLYFAYICTGDGVKILEINSRPGDPEWQNLAPIAKFDMIDMFKEIVDGNLTSLDFEDKATVVTYAVPMDYGNYRSGFTGSRQVDLSGAEKLKEKHGDNLRIYPGSMEIHPDGTTHALKSRAVCTVGIGDSIEGARNISMEAIRAIDGPLWNRTDIGSRLHIEKSRIYMDGSRSGKSS